MNVLRGIAPRVSRLQCRHLSVIARQARPAPVQPSRVIPSPYQASRTPSPLILGAIAAARHASTASPAPLPAPAAAAESVPLAPAPELPNIDTVIMDIPDVASQLTEKIGYLHDIGIRYGWEPTSLIQWILEHYHVWAGLPWWGAIAATAITLRLFMFPTILRASDSQARTQALTPVTNPITARMKEAQKLGDTQAVALLWQELSMVRRRAGIKISATLYPAILQMIVGICGFRLMSACSNLPVPGFTTGGFAHLTDLTVPDPYLILPAAMAVMLHIVVRMGGENGLATSGGMPSGLQPLMLYGMPVMFFIFMGWQPGALCVWFASTSVLSMAQGLFLQRPAVREFFGIAPLYKPTEQERGTAGQPQAATESSRSPKRKTSSDLLGGSKNPTLRRMEYQAPNLHTKVGSGRSQVIDVMRNPTSGSPRPMSSWNSDSDDMISPASPRLPGGIVAGLRSRWNALNNSIWEFWTSMRESARQNSLRAMETSRQRRKKQEIENYEKRARSRSKQK